MVDAAKQRKAYKKGLTDAIAYSTKPELYNKAANDLGLVSLAF